MDEKQITEKQLSNIHFILLKLEINKLGKNLSLSILDEQFFGNKKPCLIDTIFKKF